MAKKKQKSTDWFKAKNYGWGWYPSSLEGWTVIAVYMLGVVSLFYGATRLTVDTWRIWFALALPMLIMTGLLVTVCHAKGEKPEWRWGKKRGEEAKNISMIIIMLSLALAVLLLYLTMLSYAMYA